ncbi:TetR/AcrR family transcriptional regulator [Kroppenstedtia sanguinis]|uniref:TetR/AcrR family transcriptional regulator n=1 Tax=Kroppenstedtia sanguinis TaxID=1380684 RepID=A0ABW4C9A0_9BACL
MRKEAFYKKRHILITAMRLFSSKHYHRTSMQEIADSCGISKGSLYVYFKSKEDLLLNIFQYYFRSIEEQILQIEEDDSLSVKEKFMKEIEIKLSHYIENQEFYKMQVQEISDLEDPNIYRYLHRQNIAQMKWFEQYVIRIYGDKMKSHAADVAFLLLGIIKQYMELIILHQVPLHIKKVVPFLLMQMDFMVQGILASDVKPLINGHLWSLYLAEVDKEKVHPLDLIKQMKNQLKAESLPEIQKEEALQSLAIIEQELMTMKPRTVLLKGMLHQLEPIHSLQEMRRQLADSLQINENTGQVKFESE